MNRRTLLTVAALATLALPPVASAATVLDVYKGPECDCCGDWMAYMRNNGFKVVAHELPDVSAFRARHGITPALTSCHTALVDGYVIEGHVPAADIRRLLSERPAGARGLTVAGMKHGSPGMEMPFIKPQAYSVQLIRQDGSTRVWALVSGRLGLVRGGSGR